MKISLSVAIIWGLPWWLSGKESTCNAGDTGWITGSGRFPEKEMATHFSTLAGEFHRQRSLAGYSAWDCKRVGHELVTKNNNDHMANLQKEVQTGAE